MDYTVYLPYLLPTNCSYSYTYKADRYIPSYEFLELSSSWFALILFDGWPNHININGRFIPPTPHEAKSFPCSSYVSVWPFIRSTRVSCCSNGDTACVAWRERDRICKIKLVHLLHVILVFEADESGMKNTGGWGTLLATPTRLVSACIHSLNSDLCIQGCHVDLEQ